MNPRTIWAIVQAKGWLYPIAVACFVLMGTAVAGATTGTFSAGAADTPTATTVSDSSPPAPAAGSTVTPTADTAALPAGGGGGKNIVNVINQTDYRLHVDGRVQLNEIPGPNVEPVNLASAYSSCQNCQTLAVALQINLISKSATDVRPENAAVAVNYGCNGCDTVAVAFQYVLSVDDPTQVPAEAHQLVADMKNELATLNGQQGLTLAGAEQQVSAVIGQFQDLASSLDTKRDEATVPTSPNATPIDTPTPSPTVSSTPAETITPTESPTPSDTATPTDTGTPADTATPSAEPSATSTPTPTPGSA